MTSVQPYGSDTVAPSTVSPDYGNTRSLKEPASPSPITQELERTDTALGDLSRAVNDLEDKLGCLIPDMATGMNGEDGPQPNPPNSSRLTRQLRDYREGIERLTNRLRDLYLLRHRALTHHCAPLGR